MMKRRCVIRFGAPWILLGALALTVPGVRVEAQAAGSSAPATLSLIDKARSLEARGRMDLATQTWQQILLADPNNPDALSGLARAAKQDGNTALANTYLEKLRASHPGDPNIARVESLGAQASQMAQLQQAGKFAEAGQYAAAMALYRQVFGTNPPPGDWSLAYYETESATEDGRPHSIAGLTALVQKYPGDARYQIALGRILTYNAKTREEGRVMLRRFPADQQAQEAVRQSLLWDSADPRVAPQIRAYLATHRDAQLASALAGSEAAGGAARSGARGAGAGARASEAASREKPASASGASAQSAAESAAYKALNAKHVQEAETRFQSILAKEPQNARALAGLGYLRMQQGNFTAAISFLEQAKQDRSTDPGLEAALDTSRFWLILGEGAALLNANDLTAAEKQYRAALALRPSSAEALEGLGWTLLRAQQPAAAGPVFERDVQARPGSLDGWRGLVTAQLQQGSAPMALATDRRVPAAVHTQLMKDPMYLRTLAGAYSAVGRDAEAQTALARALTLPYAADAQATKAETQLQSAAILFAENRLEQAGELYRQVLAAEHASTAAWQGLVRVQHALGRDAEALQTVESMPPASYEMAMKDPSFETTVASVYQGQGKLDVAQELLEKTIAQQTTAGQKGPVGIQMQLAGIYMQRGNAQTAFPIYQQVLSVDASRVDAWAGLLSALHATGHDREAVTQAQQIQPGVRAQLETRVDYLQTMGAVYGALGDSREAQVFVGRVQRYYVAQHSLPPAEVDIQNAWLLYNGANDAGLYGQLMSLGGRPDLTDEQRRTVQTIWTSWAVRRANQAAAAGNAARALAILNAAARSFPDNPTVLKALASGYARAGQPGEAVLIFKSQNMTSGAVSATDYQAAVGAAMAAGDEKDAETWLRSALAAYPADPQILILAAKSEQTRGDTKRAIAYYQASLKAMPAMDPGARLASALRLPAPGTPGRLPSAAEGLELSVLLAPGSEGTPGGQPYLPSYENVYRQTETVYGQPSMVAPAPGAVGPDAPGAVPPYMTNPATGPDGKTRLKEFVAPQSSLLPGRMSESSRAEVELRVQAAVMELLGGEQVPVETVSGGVQVAGAGFVPGAELSTPQSYQRQQVAEATEQARTSPGVAPLAGANASAAENFGAFVPYVYPSAPVRAGAEERLPQPGVVAVQLGDATPHPLPPASEPTDVLPTARYVPNARGGPMTSSHPEIAAAEAASIRRRQSDTTGSAAAAAVEVSSAITENAVYVDAAAQVAQNTAAPQVRQPPVPPPSGRDVPDSGQQQYPQPGGTAPAAVSVPGARQTRKAAPRKAAPVVEPPAALIEQPSGIAAGPAAAAAPTVTPPGGQPSLAGLPAIGVPSPVGTSPSGEALMARSVPPLRGADGVQGPLAVTARQEAENALAALEGTYSGWVGGTGIGRYRSGTRGLDRLYDVEAPVEASAMLGRAVRLTAVARPVFLNSGVLNPASFGGNSVPYLGTLNANAATAPPQQFSNGIGGELQLTTRTLGLAAGYTPYEFLVRNITGRFRWRPAGGHVTLFAERDPVKDTQLSYAGLRDPGASLLASPAPIWGGVIATTGGVRLDAGSGTSGFYVSGDGGVLRGDHVLENTKYEGAMGGYFRVKNWPGYGNLTVGGSLSGMHYAHNEVGLTYGQGGYFSPDAYFLAAVPATFTGYYRTDLHYVLAGGVGVQTFQQDSAAFYPLDAALQNGFVPANGVPCTATQLAAHSCGQYPVSGDTAFNYSVHAEVSYRAAEHWYLGGFVLANNANNYNTVSAGFFFRYAFKRQVESEGSPTGLFPVDGFRPVQLP